MRRVLQENAGSAGDASSAVNVIQRNIPGDPPEILIEIALAFVVLVVGWVPLEGRGSDRRSNGRPSNRTTERHANRSPRCQGRRSPLGGRRRCEYPRRRRHRNPPLGDRDLGRHRSRTRPGGRQSDQRSLRPRRPALRDRRHDRRSPTPVTAGSSRTSRSSTPRSSRSRTPSSSFRTPRSTRAMLSITPRRRRTLGSRSDSISPTRSDLEAARRPPNEPPGRRRRHLRRSGHSDRQRPIRRSTLLLHHRVRRPRDRSGTVLLDETPYKADRRPVGGARLYIGERLADLDVEFAYPHRHHVFDKENSGVARLAVDDSRFERTAADSPVEPGRELTDQPTGNDCALAHDCALLPVSIVVMIYTPPHQSQRIRQMYDGVLIPTDGSDTISQTLAHGLPIAANNDATVHSLITWSIARVAAAAGEDTSTDLERTLGTRGQKGRRHRCGTSDGRREL